MPLATNPPNPVKFYDQMRTAHEKTHNNSEDSDIKQRKWPDDMKRNNKGKSESYTDKEKVVNREAKQTHPSYTSPHNHSVIIISVNDD